jgi:hypothetical protein
MTLKSLMQERKDAILQRWLEATMATYAKDMSLFLDKQKDPFANPVGHSLRDGTRGVIECLLEGMETEKICGHLNEMIKVRAIQDFSPSQAVSFVFLLKRVIREEIRESADRQLAGELAEMDAQIDQVALFAFDIYVKCREKVYELRVNEVKRNVSAVMGRFCGVDSEEKPACGLQDDGKLVQGGGK